MLFLCLWPILGSLDSYAQTYCQDNSWTIGTLQNINKFHINIDDAGQQTLIITGLVGVFRASGYFSYSDPDPTSLNAPVYPGSSIVVSIEETYVQNNRIALYADWDSQGSDDFELIELQTNGNSNQFTFDVPDYTSGRPDQFRLRLVGVYSFNGTLPTLSPCFDAQGFNTNQTTKAASIFDVDIPLSDWALPITLSYFRAQMQNDRQVLLTWETASEINNEYFTVEKSTDASDWHELVRIEGAGDSSEKLSYDTIDANPWFGISYYRLKQTDFDGRFSYSPIEVVYGENEQSVSPLLYPNPTTGVTWLQDPLLEVSEIEIYDSIGKKVWEKVSAVRDGTSVYLDLTHVPAGLYFLKTPSKVLRIKKE